MLKNYAATELARLALWSKTNIRAGDEAVVSDLTLVIKSIPYIHDVTWGSHTLALWYAAGFAVMMPSVSISWYDLRHTVLACSAEVDDRANQGRAIEGSVLKFQYTHPDALLY